MIEIGLLKRILVDLEDKFGANTKMIYQFSVKNSVKEELSQLDSKFYDNYTDLRLMGTIINSLSLIKLLKFDQKEKGISFHSNFSF